MPARALRGLAGPDPKPEPRSAIPRGCVAWRFPPSSLRPHQTGASPTIGLAICPASPPQASLIRLTHLTCRDWTAAGPRAAAADNNAAGRAKPCFQKAGKSRTGRRETTLAHRYRALYRRPRRYKASSTAFRRCGTIYPHHFGIAGHEVHGASGRHCIIDIARPLIIHMV